MKKFLTVLLALSVVFTYTVGTAFAATPVTTPEDTLTHDQAMNAAVTELKTELAQAVVTAKAALKDAYTETINGKTIEIKKHAYSETLDKIESDFIKVIENAAGIVDTADATKTVTDVDALKLAISSQPVDNVIAYAGTNGIKVSTTIGSLLEYNGGLATYVTETPSYDAQKYFYVYTLRNALPDIKSDVAAEIKKVDMDLYTNDVANENDPYQKTWKELAQAEVDRLNNVVNDRAINVEGTKEDAEKVVSAIYGIVPYYLEAVKETASGYAITYKLAHTPSSTLPSGVTEIKTAEDLKVDGAVTAADKASMKAEVEKNASDAYKAALEAYKANKDETAFDTKKEQIDAYSTVWNVVIDAGKVTSVNNDIDTLGTTYVARVEQYALAEKVAAALKLEVEKEGSLKYDAAKVDENLKALQVAIYMNGPEAAYSAAALKTYLAKDALIVSDNLAWEKEVAIAAINAEMDNLIYDYYTPEQEKVKAKYQEVIDKVNAATTLQQLKTITGANPQTKTYIGKSALAAAGIKDAAAVEAFLKNNCPNTDKFIENVENYLTYLNTAFKSYEDGYRNPIVDEDAVAEYLAENGARTNADVATFFAKAEEYAKAIPTNGEIKDALNAAKTLINALPTYITLADKAAVQAAYEAADKANYTSTKLDNAIADVKAAESRAIDDMLKALPTKLTAADKAAVDAILDAIDAYEAEEMYGYESYAKRSDAIKAFEAVRAATLADVQNTIAALPADATKAQVEAARAAVDAFVATYTDASEPYQAIAQIVNLDKLTYAEAQIKANEIKAVEALKITASSTAKKGSITVKWTVKGDTTAVEGYEIWRSTKKNSGFSKFFTTTKTTYKNTKSLKKGTRYYYKVRAIAHVDGKKITSDWSNKAYRIAK